MNLTNPLRRELAIDDVTGVSKHMKQEINRI